VKISGVVEQTFTDTENDLKTINTTLRKQSLRQRNLLKKIRCFVYIK